jgi:hypothetical protein
VVKENDSHQNSENKRTKKQYPKEGGWYGEGQGLDGKHEVSISKRA